MRWKSRPWIATFQTCAFMIFVLKHLCAQITKNTNSDLHPFGPTPTMDLNENTVLDRRKETEPGYEKLTTFQKIRITVIYSELKPQLGDLEITRLKAAIEDAVEIVKETFSVYPVEGPLIFTRSENSCHSKLTKGINKGKCAAVKKNDVGEECLGFMIPEMHVEELYIWNATYPKPVKTVRRRGAGIKNTDFVLYVQAKTQNNCVSEVGVMAYAKYCKLDKNSRPVAGYINACPRGLQTPHFVPEKATKAFLHEIFHTLGFSKELFGKFKNCNDTEPGDVCPERNDVIQKKTGFYRLMTPNLMRVASKHFNCPNFGVPLQEKNSKPTSHWNARFMQGSIMAPTLGMPGYTILDPITLAVFEDMGWYKVSYSHAQPYYWGRDGGCKFGSDDYCSKDNKFFCQGNTTGCHFSQRGSGVCQTDRFLQNCRVFQHNLKGLCPQSGNGNGCFETNFDENGAYSKHGAVIASCLQYTCDSNLTLYVNTSQFNQTWSVCPYGKSITFNVSGANALIRCPTQPILCHHYQYTKSTSSPIVVSNHPILPDKKKVLSVWIIFKNVDYYDLIKRGKDKVFLHKVIQTVIQITGVTNRRIRDASLHAGSTIVAINVLPSLNDDDGPSSQDVYRILYKAISTNTFSIDMDGIVLSASEIITSDGGEDGDNPASMAGVIAGSVVGGLVVISLIVVGVVMMNKYKTMQASRSETQYNIDMNGSIEMNHDQLNQLDDRRL